MNEAMVRSHVLKALMSVLDAGADCILDYRRGYNFTDVVAEEGNYVIKRRVYDDGRVVMSNML